MSGGRPTNLDRQNAIALGFKTYTGSPHAACGTTERYVSGGGCVHCARALATAQRLALKAQKAEVVNLDPEERVTVQGELDEQDAIVQDETVAEAREELSEADRFRRSIEDIL